MKHVHNEAFARHVEEHFEERRKIEKHSTLECQEVVQTDNKCQDENMVRNIGFWTVLHHEHGNLNCTTILFGTTGDDNACSKLKQKLGPVSQISLASMLMRKKHLPQ